MRSGCRGFEFRSGHLIFYSICSVYIKIGISELTSLMMNNLFEICRVTYNKHKYYQAKAESSVKLVKLLTSRKYWQLSSSSWFFKINYTMTIKWIVNQTKLREKDSVVFILATSSIICA